MIMIKAPQPDLHHQLIKMMYQNVMIHTIEYISWDIKNEILREIMEEERDVRLDLIEI